MKTDVTQVMVKEHQLILRMIKLLEHNTDLLEQGAFRHWSFFLDAVDFIRNFADRFHHAKEEDVLFVELVRNGMPEKQSPIEAMHMEHEQGRAYVQALEDAASKAAAGELGQVPLIVKNARAYAALLRAHIDKEDSILYPLAERVLPEDVRTAMLTSYERAEQRNPGAEKKYTKMVEQYERQVASRS